MAVITISTKTGCGKEVCTTLSEKLNYKVVNKELLEHASKISGINISQAEKLDDSQYSRLSTWLSEIIDLSAFTSQNESNTSGSSYSYANTPSGNNFRNAMEKTIRFLAKESNVVVVGRGGNIILKSHPKALHVKLVADLSKRIENVMNDTGFDYNKAKKHIEETDSKKAKYIEYHYKENIDNVLNYHMVLNLSKLSEQDAAHIISEAIEYL